MSHLVFMSPEHVAAMNDKLAASDEVRKAGAQLDRTYTMAYVLSDGRDGGDEYWLMSLGPSGAQFALEPKPDADIVFRGDWRAMVDASRAAREGRQVDAGVAVEGDPEVVAVVGPVFSAAQQVATLEVDWP